LSGDQPFPTNYQDPGEKRNPELVDLFQLIGVFWEAKWHIMGLTFVGIMLVSLYLIKADSIYRATVRMIIEPDAYNVLEIEKLYNREQASYLYFMTEAQILQSREMAARVVNRLDLLDNEIFYEPPKEDKKRRIDVYLDEFRTLLGSAPEPEIERTPLQQAVDTFLEAISVEFVPSTNLMDLHVDLEDPVLAAEIANVLSDEYLRYGLEEQLKLSSEASDWLDQRLQEARGDLRESESALLQFYDQEELVSVKAARGILESELADNAHRYREAVRKKAELENVYRLIVKAGGDWELLQGVPRVQDEPLVIQTKTSFLKARELVSQLSARYGPKHPRMITAQAQLDEARDAYKKQLVIAAEGIRSDYEIASETASALQSITDKSRSQIKSLDRNQAELESLERDVEANRELYQTLFSRMKETGVADKLDFKTARVIDEATPPVKPIKPNAALVLMMGSIGGFIFGVLLALLRFLLNNTILDPEDLERLSGRPLLSVLPYERSGVGHPGRMAKMEVEHSNTAFSEGIRNIRTSILLADDAKKNKKVMITSSVPSEGKTSVAINLAIAMGKMEKVLLVETDLRRPSITKCLNIVTQGNGIFTLMAQKAQLSECITRYEEGGIDVLPAGRGGHNPAELIASLRFRHLVDILESQYDRIIFDSAPCQAVSDPLMLSRVSDAVIFLVRADDTKTDLVLDSIKKIRMAQANLLGTVLNQYVPKRGQDYRYQYYREYYSAAT